MKKGSLYSEAFSYLAITHDTVPIVEKTAHEGQVLGHFPSAPRRFDSEQLGSRAAYVEAAGFEATDTNSGWRHGFPFGTCTGTIGTIEATADVGEQRPPYRRSISSRRLSSRCRSGWINRFASAMGRPPCSERSSSQ